MTVTPVLSGPSVGAYRVNFGRFGANSILTTDLDFKQVRSLAALLNDFQKTSELFTIVAIDRSNVTGLWYYVPNTGWQWYCSYYSLVQTLSESAAKSAWPAALASQPAGTDEVKLLTYAQAQALLSTAG